MKRDLRMIVHQMAWLNLNTLISRHMTSALKLCLYVAIVTLSAQVHAQNPDDGGGGGESVSNANQLGVFISRLLPHGVSDEDEIMQLWGLRYSYALNSGGYLDFGAINGSGSGVDWLGMSAGASMHVPIETLIGHAGIGVDMTRYETSTQSQQNEIGLHFLGGVMAHIGGTLLARFDMKLASKPGTYLLFAIGIVYEFGASSAGGGEQ